jgi:hypothetical protein
VFGSDGIAMNENEIIFWNSKRSQYKFAIVNYVEQQCPMIDSLFFQFFIKTVIVPNRNVYDMFKTDFGPIKIMSLLWQPIFCWKINF